MRPPILFAAASALALGAGGCAACDDTSFGDAQSSIVTDTDLINLGRVYVGASARATFVLSAPGERPVSYTTHLEGEVFGHQIGPANGILSPNGSVEMLLVFRPARAGSANARIVIESDATLTSSATVEIRAAALDPPDCEDGNGCTEDTFNLETGECDHAASRLACEDFNACTDGDTCVEGICLGQGKDCNDNDVCTDDLCEPAQGCVNLPTIACSDDNPCTRDTCDPTLGCQHVVLDDGTPCDDFEQCTIADICLLGRCVGVNLPEGMECDDGNPCSKMDQCVMGHCEDPTYREPGIGELRFVADVGPLAEGASANPIIDRDSTVFVGVEGGVTAIDQCGEQVWTNLAIGTPRWRSAVSLPGLLTVPVGSKIVDLDTAEGDMIRELDLAELFTVPTASTSTSSVRILDMALRSSGGVVVSLVRETVPLDGSSDEVSREGLIAEIDRFHTAAARFRDLGGAHASRLIVDNDEAVVAIVREGPPDKDTGEERLVRFGLSGLPETSWSTSEVRARHTELAFGPADEVLWTAGLLSVGRRGELLPLLDGGGDVLPASGSPVLSGTKVALVTQPPPDIAPNALGLAFAGRPAVLMLDAGTGVVSWEYELEAPAPRMSPVADLGGKIYVTTADGVLHAILADGAPYFTTELPITTDTIADVALAIAPRGTVVAVAEGRVFGVQSMSPLANSAWPRHRRDNLSTGHR